jgi:hypothetical protein
MTVINPENAAEQIVYAREQVKHAQSLVRYFERYLSHPVVIPVVTYWQYHQKITEDYDWGFSWDVAADAWGYLNGMADEGLCSPDKVTVGGAEVEEP